MNNCRGTCRLCDRKIISTAVTFANGNLTINIPDGNYQRNCRYCIVVAQAIPTATTIEAPVYVTIGAGTTLYPFNRCDGTQATACQIRSRTRYAMCVQTTDSGGSFRMIGGLPCAPDNALTALPVQAVTSEG